MFLADETYLLGRACLFFLRSNLRKSFNDSKDNFDGLFFFSTEKMSQNRRLLDGILMVSLCQRENIL